MTANDRVPRKRKMEEKPHLISIPAPSEKSLHWLCQIAFKEGKSLQTVVSELIEKRCVKNRLSSLKIEHSTKSSN